MTDNERYLFDTRGYVTVPEALSSRQLQELNELLDGRIAEEMPSDAQTHRFGNLLEWGAAYRDLIDNAAVLAYLEAMYGERFRLDHVYLDVIRSGLSPIGATLHGGGAPFNPVSFYNCSNGRIRCGLTVVVYNLADVGPQDGGFACVPGSHKANFPFPAEWKDLEQPEEFVHRVTGPAGTAVIFTEALTHGPLPWRGDHERRTLFFKYNNHGSSWSAEFPDPTQLPLSERQQAILEPPNARYSYRPLPWKPRSTTT